MDNNIKVSVLVVTYNQELFIRETIESILSQETDFRFELIVANDCSTDDTTDIINEYVSKYPQIIKHLIRPKNLGLIGNLFDGLINHCTGKYISLCAGDDYWSNSAKLQKQVDFLDANPKYSMVHTGYQKFIMSTRSFVDADKWVSSLQYKYGKNEIKAVLLEEFSSFPVASSMMFRGPETLQELKKCEHLYVQKQIPGEGMLLFSIFTLLGAFGYIDDICTVYRVQDSSACHIQDYKKKYLFNIKYSAQKLEIADSFNIQKRYKIKLMVKHILGYLYSCNENHEIDYLEALNDYKEVSYSKYYNAGSRIIRLISKCRIIKNFCLLALKLKNYGVR